MASRPSDPQTQERESEIMIRDNEADPIVIPEGQMVIVVKDGKRSIIHGPIAESGMPAPEDIFLILPRPKTPWKTEETR